MRTTPPALNKKVVYLDQWVISELANQLDPVLRAKKRGRLDTFWRELYGDIETLVKLQVIVCPESPLHYRESLVTPYLEVLRPLYEHLAVGTRFDEPLQIHVNQLYDQFLKVVCAESRDGEVWASRERMLHGKLNDWPDRIRISARFPLRTGEVVAERALRAAGDKHLGDDSEKWRRVPGRSFADWYAHHRRDLTDVVLRCFQQGIFGVFAWTCQSMVERLERGGMASKAAFDIVVDFLKSDAATRTPYCQISSLLFAAISTKIADSGQKAAADHGDHNDIHAIAAYLPYSNVICVDNYFEEILRRREVAAEIAQYGTHVFSPRLRGDFQQHLRGLRRDMPQDLHDTVLAVYGPKWMEPYDTILEYNREKQSRK
jgi:hypothetical protein